MPKRKDPKVETTDGAKGTGKAVKPQNGIARPAAELASVQSPELVPPQTESSTRKAGADQAAPSRSDEVAAPVETAQAAPAEVVTVSFAQAAAEAAAAATPVRDSEPEKADVAAAPRTRRFLPLAATIALAAAVGAMTGSLATSGISSLMAADHPTQSAGLEDSRSLKETIAQLGADVAALRTHIDNSANAAGMQFSRLSERLDRADRAQADSAVNLARLAESLDRRAAAPQPADPATTGSIIASPAASQQAPATRPAGQPIVEGWTLRNVHNGVAVIQGGVGLVQVEPGDTLQGLGRIETIRRQDGRWVVVTNRGLVIAR